MRVQPKGKTSRNVVDVELAAGHSSPDIEADVAEDGYGASGHVLAAVIARAFDDGGRARVADCEALAGAAGDEELAAGCAVENGIAEQHCIARVVLRREYDKSPATHSLAGVVVAFTDDLQLDS